MASNENAFLPRMPPNDPEKLNTKRTFLIGFGFFTAMVAWSYFNFRLPLLLTMEPNPLVPADIMFLGTFGQNSIVGAIMTLDNIIAILLQPYFGALSDRAASKHGRRTPFLLIGCTIGAIFFTLIPIAALVVQTLAAVIGVVLCFNLAMAFYRAPIVALCPDLTAPKVRSSANAIINLMGGLGTVIAYATPTLIKNIPNEIILQFGFISMWMLVGMLIVFFTIKETPTGTGFLKINEHAIGVDPVTFEIRQDDGDGEAVIKSSIKDDLVTVFKEEDKSALLMLFAIFSWFFGFNAIEVFYPLYAVKYLGWTEGNASLVLMVLPVALIAFAIPAGKISEKIGRRKAIKIGLYIIVAICFTVYFFQNIVVVGILLAIAGAAWGMVNINSITVIWQLAPEGKVGSYTGVYYTFSQLAAILSPVVMGVTVDAIGVITANPGPHNYVVLFPYVLIWMAIALVCMSRVRRGEAELTAEQLEEYREKYEQDD